MKPVENMYFTDKDSEDQGLLGIVSLDYPSLSRMAKSSQLGTHPFM